MFSFLKQSFVALTLRISGVALNLLIFAVLAKTLSIHEVGIYSLIASIALIGRYLGPFGLDQIALRSIPQYREENKLAEANALQKVLLTYAAIASSVVASIFLILAIIFFRDDVLLVPIALSTVLIYCFSVVSGVCAGILRGHGRVFSAFFPDSVLSFFVTALLTAMSTLLGTLTIALALYFAAAGAICAGLLQLFSVWRTSSSIVGPADFALVRQSASLKKAAHFWLVMAGNFLQVRSSLYIAFLIGSATASALMDTAMKFALVPTLTTWAVGSVCAPRLVSMRSRGDLQGIRNILFAGAWISFVPSLLFLVAFVFWGELVIEKFLSVDYVSAYLATILFILSTCINSFLSLASTYLMYADDEISVLKFTLAGLFCTVFVGYLLGETSLGVTGVAIAVLLSGLCRDGGLAFVLYRKTGLIPGVSASVVASAWSNRINYFRKGRR